jgi:ABC-type transporter Mla MlaB component
MVPELLRAWQELVPTLDSKKLSVDLCGVTYIDSTGTELLSEIHRQSGADFLADTPYTRYFASRAKSGL